jgi:hypothetical protein
LFKIKLPRILSPNTGVLIALALILSMIAGCGVTPYNEAIVQGVIPPDDATVVAEIEEIARGLGYIRKELNTTTEFRTSTGEVEKLLSAFKDRSRSNIELYIGVNKTQGKLFVFIQENPRTPWGSPPGSGWNLTGTAKKRFDELMAALERHFGKDRIVSDVPAPK